MIKFNTKLRVDRVKKEKIFKKNIILKGLIILDLNGLNFGMLENI